MVISRLDYGNAVLAGLAHASTVPLQRIANSAARLVFGLWPSDHVIASSLNFASWTRGVQVAHRRTSLTCSGVARILSQGARRACPRNQTEITEI